MKTIQKIFATIGLTVVLSTVSVQASFEKDDFGIPSGSEDVSSLKLDAASKYPLAPALNRPTPILMSVVPEPTTIIAGTLLLLPFGVSTVRILRRNKG